MRHRCVEEFMAARIAEDWGTSEDASTSIEAQIEGKAPRSHGIRRNPLTLDLSLWTPQTDLHAYIIIDLHIVTCLPFRLHFLV